MQRLGYGQRMAAIRELFADSKQRHTARSLALHFGISRSGVYPYLKRGIE